MKKIAIVFTLFFVFLTVFAEGYLQGTFLDIKGAKKRWGVLEFNSAKFIQSDEKTKGAMAVNVIEKKLYLNKPMSDVRKQIGDPDSYFFSDTIYAYEITPPKAKSEQWHLVFIPDEKLEKVKEVKIHKKCCYN